MKERWVCLIGLGIVIIITIPFGIGVYNFEESKRISLTGTIEEIKLEYIYNTGAPNIWLTIKNNETIVKAVLKPDRSWQDSVIINVNDTIYIQGSWNDDFSYIEIGYLSIIVNSTLQIGGMISIE